MDSRVARPLTLAAAGATAFVALLVAAYFVAPVAHWDATALYGLRTLSEHHWIAVLDGGIVRSADPVPLALALAALCCAGVIGGRYRQALGALLLVGGACVATALLKIALAHPRYQPILASEQLDVAAFPSGHATAAMSLTMAAVLIAPSRLRLAVGIAGGAYALAVSIALMTLGWHFPSDVVGGFLVSGTASMLVLAGLRAVAGVERAGGHRVEVGRIPIESIGTRMLELLGAAGAIAAVLLALTHSSELTSFAAGRTSALAAAIGVVVAGAGLVYAVAAELETR